MKSTLEGIDTTSSLALLLEKGSSEESKTSRTEHQLANCYGWRRQFYSPSMLSLGARSTVVGCGDIRWLPGSRNKFRIFNYYGSVEDLEHKFEEQAEPGMLTVKWSPPITSFIDRPNKKVGPRSGCSSSGIHYIRIKRQQKDGSWRLCTMVNAGRAGGGAWKQTHFEVTR
jgi:hypothetical protein